MHEITEKLESINEIKNCIEKINQKTSPILILGLSDVAKACIIETIYEKQKRQTLLITYNELMAQNLHKHIRKINENTIYIPKKDIITYAYDAQSMDILSARIEGIKSLLNEEDKIIIVSTETLITPILSKKKITNSILKIIVANEYNIEEIKEKLVLLGYERQDLVEGKGTFSVRGDILDIAITSKQGIRIEFFGDEVDQIRYFDIQNQRSTENINQIKIYPVSEEIDQNPTGNLLEYLSEDCIIAIDEINKIKLRANNILEDNKLLQKDLIEKQRPVPYVLENMYNIEDILEKAEKYQTLLMTSVDISKEKETISIEHEKIKEIEEKFYEITKQEKQDKTYKPRTKRVSEFRNAEKVTFSDLKVGDYVVHKTHGIGVYIGVNEVKADGITKDYIKIKYTGEDILYIPTESLDNIRKYIGGDKAPKINKLGGKDWENTKQKVKSNLREVARNLIELYAKRQKVQGFAFEKDTPWQKEFEDSFPYEETEDQLRCIEEVKQDMEKAKPMDRLLCGDVGYGKTEVALRAAFKAVMSGKQVAYLVPTTILANQQYESFKERMDKFRCKSTTFE